MPARKPDPKTPDGEIALRVVPMPADTNALGKIFGGWVLSQMDIAGGLHVRKLTKQQMVTVAVESMKFHKPVEVADEVTCYTRTGHVGRTSIAVVIETWVRKPYVDKEPEHVTSGIFIYVAIGKDGRPVPLKLKKA